MGLLVGRGGFVGGMYLSDDKAQTQDVPIRDLPTPARLRVPLAQFREPAAEPRVQPGQRVRAGEPIAVAAADGSVAVHSPINAAVSTITTVDTPYREGVPAIELDTVATSTEPPSRAAGRADRCTGPELFDAAVAAGVYPLDPLSARDAAPLDWLIVNALESELVQTVALRTLIERGDEVVSAASWLGGVLGVNRVCLTVDRRRRRVLADLRRAARGTPVRLVALPNKYPGSFGPLLVAGVTGRQMPYLGRAADVGVYTLDVCALLDLRRAVESGTPQTHTLVTVAGDAVERPGCYRVPVGAGVGDIAGQVGLGRANLQAAADSLLLGPLVRHRQTVLTKHTRALIFWRDGGSPLRQAMGCIRCGLCQDHCPVGLDPRALLDLVERRRFDLAARRSPAVCVECGLCDYVCPSALPLMRAVQRSRRHVLAE